jgi:glycerol uptake facilitator-like aquaporin
MSVTGVRHYPWIFRPLLAEFLGSALLVMTIVGSGISAQRLSPDNIGLQLLGNSLSIMLGLAVLIEVFGPISGAHFNPVVSAAAWFLSRGRAGGVSGKQLLGYICAQIIGAISGCGCAI